MERTRQILCLALASLLATIFYANGHLMIGNLTPSDAIYSSIQSEWYIPHNPIDITDNQDFIMQGWPGNGTEMNPFVVENLSIAIDGSGSCISVKDTSVHFIIRNCMLSSSAEFPYMNLVRLQFFNVEKGNVENCSVFGQIDIQYSRSCRIFNNTISPYETDYVVFAFESQMVNISCNMISPSIESEYGVFLGDSDNCVLSQNVVRDNGWMHYPSTTTTMPSRYNGLTSRDPSKLEPLQDVPDGGGIIISGGSSCTVSENRIIENVGDALRVYNSPNLVLIRNEMHDNDFGVTLGQSESLLISENNITGFLRVIGSVAATIVDNQILSGNLEFLFAEHLDDVTHTVSNNTIDGWPLLYLLNEISITVEADKTGQIILVNCTDTEIRDSIVEGFGGSIEFYFCSNSALVNGRCSMISILKSDACRVENLEIDESFAGIYTGCSPRTVIRNNTIHDTTRGIYLSHCSFSTITKNRIFEVERNGIVVSRSDNTVIEENDVTYCAKPEYYYWYNEKHSNSAIDLFYSNDSFVINNTVLDNYGYGIRISASGNVTVYYNRLSGNAEGNAYDSGTNNQWDDGISIGNYWGDYIGVGIYNIPGLAGSVDRYPFDINGSAAFRILSQWIVYALVFVGVPIIGVHIWRRNEGVPQPEKSLHASQQEFILPYPAL
ncbi:MAG: nitrous oxide reductase family maturation protein NosD [Candidatus Thorarchaeota archaeon]